MDDHREGLDPAAKKLRAAMRVARIEAAERSQAVTDLRDAEVARLELLQEAIEPVLAQVPDDIEMFDCGLTPSPRPRLFVDMVAHVEMAHDKRRYRFIQSTRQGRTVMAEGEDLDAMVEAVTAYVARRLVDRQQALAVIERCAPVPAHAGKAEPRRGPFRTLGAVVLEYLGIFALCVLVVVLVRLGWALVSR